MDDKILKVLREMNKTLISIRVFIIAQVQLEKSVLVDLQRQTRDIQKIKLMMEEKEKGMFAKLKFRWRQ